MTNTAPMALMAAALFLAVQGQPRAQETLAAECPCDFTTDGLPLWKWKGTVGITSEACDLTTLAVNNPQYPSPTFVTGQVYCIRRDTPAGKPSQKWRGLSDDEVKACSQMIIEYAQKLKESPPPHPPTGPLVIDSACALK